MCVCADSIRECGGLVEQRTDMVFVAAVVVQTSIFFVVAVVCREQSIAQTGTDENDALVACVCKAAIEALLAQHDMTNRLASADGQKSWSNFSCLTRC